MQQLRRYLMDALHSLLLMRGRIQFIAQHLPLPRLQQTCTNIIHLLPTVHCIRGGIDWVRGEVVCIMSTEVKALVRRVEKKSVSIRGFHSPSIDVSLACIYTFPNR
jgi:hypothetical protein